eukprot:CAMPEP_0205803810 /NCGR_PEP_ID=MMETSP0205-20121125/6556_1 /ASSEMBLY_ACC=CAM_ASM_000278 /TAXON_ID=36767 /ORGANISM="Euplotes focardii, Strain TN1" /LENGTH=58 /DNA_ID=CAMNT_0053072445 /DNA_START=285 /DNA_END=461 /DNA_ORIENTATION=-
MKKRQDKQNINEEFRKYFSNSEQAQHMNDFKKMMKNRDDSVETDELDMKVELKDVLNI